MFSEDHLIETLNGVSLYYEIHGSGEGEPLLLLHGFSGCSQDRLPLIPAWSARFQLIVPDLRGHGRSGALASPFRHGDAAADIIALLDRLGVGAFQGVGVSAGATSCCTSPPGSRSA